ncbi:MAG TPA: hypothetical protein PLN52_18385 [Opitutaceae bacterium]|nr:hypothetical protein [Opitutaceae bacterium]
MSSSDTLHGHLQLCEELHQLALEENRFIKENQRAPDHALLERRKALLERLDASLLKIKDPATTALPAERAQRDQRRDVVEKSRTRILQILHLQKENEQLVLRYSLGTPKLTSPAPTLPTTHLQKLYDRHR